MKKNPSVIIVDDHDTIVSGLKYELKETFKEFEFTGITAIHDALLLFKKKSFDIAIVDISFKSEVNSDGINLVAIIKQKYPETKIISYTSYADKIQYVSLLQELNVEGIVSKFDGNNAIKSAVEQLLLNQTPFYSSGVLQTLKISKAKNEIHISKRERDFIKLLRQHFTFKEIANKLGVSKNTVDFHAKNLYAKFEVHKASELLEKVGEYF